MGAIDTLAAAGFNQNEIGTFASQKRSALVAGGFSAKEIDDYLGTAPRAASGLIEALEAGFQGSATGLMLRGKLPDVVLDPQHSKWYERILATAGQVVSELPEMVIGGVAGGAAGAAAGGAAGSVVPVLGTAGGAAVGGVLGTGAGAFALPAAIRESYMQALSKGEVTGSGDFLARTAIVLKQTGKEAFVGATTFGVGGAVARGVGKAVAPAVGQSLSVPVATGIISGAQATAELGTMVVTPAALEGRLPEPEDFLNAAVLLVGLKGAGYAAGKLRSTWAKTGIPPEQVVADAQRDPTIREDLMREPAKAYHGTADEIRTFSMEFAGHTTRAESAKGAIWFTDDPQVASGYATVFADRSTREAARALENAKKSGDPAQIQAAQKAFDVINAERTGSRITEGANVVPVYLHLKNPLEVDFVGKDYSEGAFTRALEQAKAEGRDGVIFRNVQDDPVDYTRRSTVYAVLDPEIIRSQFEAVPRAYQDLAASEAAIESVPTDAVKVADVISNLEGKITAEKVPNHVNYRYVDQPQDVQAILARVSEVFQAEIAERRGAPKGWDESMGEARKALAESLGIRPDALQRGNLALDAEILAKNALMQRAAQDVAETARAIRSKGAEAAEADFAAQAAAVETLAMVQANFLGNAAELGRALNAMKAARQARDLASGLGEVLAKYGSDPHLLARMIGEMQNVSQVSKFARNAGKASTMEQLVEAFKMSIISGPLTHGANLLGNTIFAGTRPLVDAVAAAVGAVTRAEERVAAVEPLARIAGNMAATWDVLRMAGALMRAGRFGEMAGKVFSKDTGPKVEQYRKAIPGKTAEIARRATFGLLTSTDSFFKDLNRRGEAYALAAREATREGLNPLTREFRERMMQITAEPTEAMLKQMDAAALRYTFNIPLGDFGKKLQGMVAAHPVLGFIVPFIRTPGNILKELVRMTPASPLVKEWRDAAMKGGAEQQKAIAELAIGTSIMSGVVALVFEGTISGQGNPDPRKRAVQLASGWQPYSIKIGDTWYSYQRLQPVGTLIGMAADASEVWDAMTDEERNAVPKMIATAFANAVTNQTFLQGITNVIRAMDEPQRFGPRIAESYAGSVVPNIVAQPVRISDPFVREVNGILDAVRARLPVAREGLPAKLDVFGEPIQTKGQVVGALPISTVQESKDKVRTEAARIGFGTGQAPKKVHVGRGTGKLGDVPLEPEQRHLFQEVSGKFAHDILTPIVNSPTWDDLPDLIKRKVYAKAFLYAHRAGAAAALPPDLRAAVAEEIAEKLTSEMGQ